LLDGMALDEVVQTIEELAILHHVRHDVLPLVVQVAGDASTNEALKNKRNSEFGYKESFDVVSRDYCLISNP
jgi:hypothetical protein